MNSKAISELFVPGQFRRWLLVLVVGLASLASYWALEIIRNQSSHVTNKVQTRPDYFVEQFNFIKMSPGGETKYRIVGAKMDYYSFDDHADVTLPVITNLDQTQSPLTIRSQRATINNMTNQPESTVHLYEKVVLDRPRIEKGANKGTTKGAHIRLNTEYLLVHPNKNTAETDFPVELMSDNIKTSGIGMRSNTNTEQIQILKNVHSTIPPNSETKD